jgi:hypothetical protein
MNVLVGDEIVFDENTWGVIEFVLGGRVGIPRGGSVRVVGERSVEMTGYLLAKHIKHVFLQSSKFVIEAATIKWIGSAASAVAMRIPVYPAASSGSVAWAMEYPARAVGAAAAEIAALEANILHFVSATSEKSSVRIDFSRVIGIKG